MEFTKLSKEEYIEFQSNHSQKNFLNSYSIVDLKNKNGFETALLGVKENGIVVAATAIIFQKTKRIFKYAYAPRGLIVDYSNKELVAFFTKNIKSFLKRHKAVFLICEPYVLLQKRDRFGKVLEGIDNHWITDELTKLGYKHRGYTVGIDASNCRFMYQVDIPFKTEEELLKSFERNTRREVENAKKNCIQLRKMDRSELSVFVDVIKSTERRRSFSFRGLKYYEDMYDAFSPINAISFRCCEMNVKEALTLCESEIKSFNEEISLMKSKSENLSKKQVNKINEKENQLKKLEKRKNEFEKILAEKGEKIILSAGMWYEYAGEYLCLISGTFEEYLSFSGPHYMHYEMMREITQRDDIERYNFYGISGDFTDNAVDKGVLAFKQSFGGYIDELLGEYYLVINPFLYKLIQKM